MHFTDIDNISFCQDLGRHLGLQVCPCQRLLLPLPSHSTTGALERAWSCFWSISYTWKAGKPFRRRTRSLYSIGVFIYLNAGFAGWSQWLLQALTAQLLEVLPARLPCHRMPITDLFLDYLTCSLHLLNGKQVLQGRDRGWEKLSFHLAKSKEILKQRYSWCKTPITEVAI